jgi:hypothetical protein
MLSGACPTETNHCKDGRQQAWPLTLAGQPGKAHVQVDPQAVGPVQVDTHLHCSAWQQVSNLRAALDHAGSADCMQRQVRPVAGGHLLCALRLHQDADFVCNQKHRSQGAHKGDCNEQLAWGEVQTGCILTRSCSTLAYLNFSVSNTLTDGTDGGALHQMVLRTRVGIIPRNGAYRALAQRHVGVRRSTSQHIRHARGETTN